MIPSHIPHTTVSEALRAYADTLDREHGTEYTDRHGYLREMADEFEGDEQYVKIMNVLKIAEEVSGRYEDVCHEMSGLEHAIENMVEAFVPFRLR